MPLLIAGEHPALTVLREQYRSAAISDVELSGAGFFVNFEVPPDAPRVTPPTFFGGNALVSLSGLRYGAGCVLFVRYGSLSWLEGHTFGEEWPESAAVLALDDVTPLDSTKGNIGGKS